MCKQPFSLSFSLSACTHFLSNIILNRFCVKTNNSVSFLMETPCTLPRDNALPIDLAGKGQ